MMGRTVSSWLPISYASSGSAAPSVPGRGCLWSTLVFVTFGRLLGGGGGLFSPHGPAFFFAVKETYQRLGKNKHMQRYENANDLMLHRNQMPIKNNDVQFQKRLFFFTVKEKPKGQKKKTMMKKEPQITAPFLK